MLRLGPILFLLFITGCKGDGATSIINGYQIVYISNDSILIDYAGADNKDKVTLEARIDAYKVEGDKILVARTPQEVYKNERGNSDYRMLPTCEYWIIDTKKHTLNKVNPINDLHCR